MRFNKLDLNQLVVLDAVLETRSIKEAGQRLFLSAPATSCALGRLRDYFKDDLLVQVGRKMVLTAKAESLRKSVRDVLMQVQALTTANPSFDPKTATRAITIEASDYVIQVFLAEVVRRAWIEAPLMRFDIRLSTPGSAASLDSGQADLLIGPEVFIARGHPTEALFEDTWSCLVWRDNPLVGETLTMAQYMELGHLGGGWPGWSVVTYDESTAKQQGHARKRQVSTPHFTTGPPLLVGTNRIGTVPTRLARWFAEHLPLRVVDCPMTVPPLIEFAQWHKYQETDPAITWLLDLLRRVASDMPSAAAPRAAAPAKTAPRRRRLPVVEA